MDEQCMIRHNAIQMAIAIHKECAASYLVAEAKVIEAYLEGSPKILDSEAAARLRAQIASAAVSANSRPDRDAI